MRISQRDGHDERKVLSGMVVSKSILGKISDSWVEGGLFSSSWANIVAKLCLDYYDQYSDAPGKEIETLFVSWSSEDRDEDTVDLVSSFLDKLSKEFERNSQDVSNTEYILDLADKLFNRVSLRKLSESVAGDIERGKVEEAKKRVTDYAFVEVNASSGIDVMTDKATLQSAFEEAHQPLLNLPGDMGRFFGTSLERDALVAILAGEKKGKTFWLTDLAWRLALNRKKVAFLSVGDMSLKQIERRFAIRAARQPMKPRTIQYPKKWMKDSDGKLVAEYEDRVFKKPLSWQVAWKAMQKVRRFKLRSEESFLKLSVHPNSSLSVKGIESLLQQWERNDWVADAIVLDYADVLLSNWGTTERDRVNQTWKELRALSQRWHNLVLTATQADAGSYETPLLSEKNFSEDKRKLAHVTGMFGLNQTKDEKNQGRYRLNWIVGRDDDNTNPPILHVAGSLAVGRPSIISTF